MADYKYVSLVNNEETDFFKLWSIKYFHWKARSNFFIINTMKFMMENSISLNTKKILKKSINLKLLILYNLYVRLLFIIT